MFEKQIKYIDELENNVESQFEKTIIDYGFVLKDYIINKQLFREGIDGNGKKLAGYTRTTIRMKIAKGDPSDRTTLRDKGEFYAQIQINAFSDRFEVTSNVPYDKYIFKRYGKDVLKITKENMVDFMFTYFLPNLKRNVNNKFAK